MRIKAVCTMLLLLTPAVATAIEWPGDWQGEWKGHADIGYSAASGNSETRHLYAGLGLEYSMAPWTHSLQFTALKEEDDGNTNAERYQTQAKSEYALSEDSYAFGALIYEFDEFGGVRERMSETLGYGRKVFTTEIHTLEAELGLGARQSELQDGSEESEAIIRAGLAYHRHISDSASLDQDVLIEAGESNTYVESVSALKLKINGNLHAKLGYTIKYNDTVPAGVDDTDTYTNVSLSYEF